MSAVSLASASPPRQNSRSSLFRFFILGIVFAFATFPPPPFRAVVDAVEIATTPTSVRFDAAKRVQFDVSFDLNAVRRRDGAATAKNEAAVAVFQTDFTLLLLDGSNAGGSGVVRGVTETRQFRGKWGRKGNAAVEGTLIQNYDVDLARIQDLKHKWEIVDERYGRNNYPLLPPSLSVSRSVRLSIHLLLFSSLSLSLPVSVSCSPTIVFLSIVQQGGPLDNILI